MKTTKIAVACFIGGIICSAIALVATPAYWWLGLIAGLAAGYIAHEFREVLKAIPVALTATAKSFRVGGSSVWNGSVETITDIRRWLSRAHPIFCPAAIIAVSLCTWFIYCHHLDITKSADSKLGAGLLLAFIFTMFSGQIILLTMGILVTIAQIGARSSNEYCDWWPILSPNQTGSDEHTKRLEADGFQKEQLNYRNLIRWLLKGSIKIVLFFTWTIWKYLIVALFKALYFLGVFAWQLFILIHSNERLLCAIDGTLGGAMSYIWLAPTATSITAKIVLVLFGGFLGAAFGVLNWEIVSKRILHIQVQPERA